MSLIVQRLPSPPALADSDGGETRTRVHDRRVQRKASSHTIGLRHSHVRDAALVVADQTNDEIVVATRERIETKRARGVGGGTPTQRGDHNLRACERATRG